MCDMAGQLEQQPPARCWHVVISAEYSFHTVVSSIQKYMEKFSH